MCEFMIALQKPFPAEDIEWRVGATSADKSKGVALAYLTNRAIMSRLDELFGPFGWRNEFREWKGSSQLCGISIKHEGEWITKWDGADDSQTEAVKGGLSDAMKRAGYQWGIGRYLYNLDPIWVPLKQAGRSYVLVSEPKLPKWALPEGYEQKIKENIPADESLVSVSDEDLNALQKASDEFTGKADQANPTNTPTPTTDTDNFISEKQAKFLYMMQNKSKYKDLPKEDVYELISASLSKTVTDFRKVEKGDINKIIKWFESIAA
jgi:hypothetical protein